MAGYSRGEGLVGNSTLDAGPRVVAPGPVLHVEEEGGREHVDGLPGCVKVGGDVAAAREDSGATARKEDVPGLLPRSPERQMTTTKDTARRRRSSRPGRPDHVEVCRPNGI